MLSLRKILAPLDKTFVGSMRRRGFQRKLRHNSLLVTFTKQDGSERIMFCTTHPSCLPEKYQDEPEQKLGPPPKVFPVWDLEKEAWRSLRWDSISQVEIVERL